MRVGGRVDIGISVVVAGIIALASIFMAASSQVPAGKSAKLYEDELLPAATGNVGPVVAPREEQVPDKEPSWQQKKNALLKKTLDYQRIGRNVHELVNEHRESLGLRQLKWDFDLAAVASRHSTAMITSGYFDHVEPSGFDVADRYRLNKIACSLKVTNANAESIYRSGESVIEMTEHEAASMMFGGLAKSVIRNPDAQYIGAGISIDEKGRLYATANLC